MHCPGHPNGFINTATVATPESVLVGFILICFSTTSSLTNTFCLTNLLYASTNSSCLYKPLPSFGNRFKIRCKLSSRQHLNLPISPKIFLKSSIPYYTSYPRSVPGPSLFDRFPDSSHRRSVPTLSPPESLSNSHTAGLS